MNFFKNNPFSKGSLAMFVGILSGFSLLASMAILLLNDLSAAEATMIIALLSTSISLFLLSAETKNKKKCNISKQE